MAEAAKVGFLGVAGAVALAVMCLGGTATSVATPMATGPSVPAAPSSTSSTTPPPEPAPPVDDLRPDHDLGGGAGGGMG